MSKEFDILKSLFKEVIDEAVEEAKAERAERRKSKEAEEALDRRVAAGEAIDVDTVIAMARDYAHGAAERSPQERVDVPSVLGLEPELLQLVESLAEEAYRHYDPDDRRWPERYDSGRKLLELPSERRPAVIMAAVTRLDRSLYAKEENEKQEVVRQFLLLSTRGRLSMSQRDVERLAAVGAIYEVSVDVPVKRIVKLIQRFVDEHGRTERLESYLEAWGGLIEVYDSETRAGHTAITKLLAVSDGAPLVGDRSWVERVQRDVAGMEQGKQSAWVAMMRHAQDATASKPSKKWIEAARPHLLAIGEAEFRSRLSAWIDAVVEHEPAEWPLDPKANGDVVKGMVWACLGLEGEAPTSAIANLAEFCFRKVPHHGAVSKQVGNASIHVLAALPGSEGISSLVTLTTRIRYPSTRDFIESLLEEAAARRGMARTDLEELSVQSFDLDDEGRSETTLGGHVASITIEDGRKPVLSWRTADGKTLKSVPQAVKRDHAAELKTLRKHVKDMEKSLTGLRRRLEGWYLHDRELAFDDWRARYLDHPLVRHLARRLIWQVGVDGKGEEVIWRDGRLVAIDGTPVQTGGEAEAVRLWHPIDASTERVHAWRRALADRQITQPFKQAHREIYVLTDAERETDTYSNRFTSHILAQHQMAELAKERGWSYRLQGGFDDANSPWLELTPGGLAAELDVEPLGSGDTSPAGIFLLVTTGKTSFYRENEPVSLSKVPALVFSEVLRDIDLFVGVSSIGTDAEWGLREVQGPEERYWHGFAFGELSETAKSRRAALEELLPSLSIRDKVRLEDRYLVVTGAIRTYRIHLGSSNVLMEPDNQYLCIVAAGKPARERARIRLPFQGDSLLSLILSKAFLVAEDRKIKDETIRAQIRPREDGS